MKKFIAYTFGLQLSKDKPSGKVAAFEKPCCATYCYQTVDIRETFRHQFLAIDFACAEIREAVEEFANTDGHGWLKDACHRGQEEGWYKDEQMKSIGEGEQSLPACAAFWDIFELDADQIIFVAFMVYLHFHRTGKKSSGGMTLITKFRVLEHQGDHGSSNQASKDSVISSLENIDLVELPL